MYIQRNTVHTSMYEYILDWSSIYKYILVYTSICGYIQICKSMHEYIWVYTWIKLYISVHSSICWYVTSTSLCIIVNSNPTIPHRFSKRKDSGLPYGCADAAATDGRRRGSNVYEVNSWLWQVEQGKPRLGGLTIEQTSKRKDAVSNALYKGAAETVRHCKAAPAWFEVGDVVWQYVLVCTSMYEYVWVRICIIRGCKIHDLHLCFFTVGSKIQCALLIRRISTFMNNRS